MGFREHILYFKTAFYIPVRYIVIDHILLPLTAGVEGVTADIEFLPQIPHQVDVAVYLGHGGIGVAVAV